jgi:N-methylhydantoinase B
MGWVMIRTSRSPIFNQSHDFSCFITDAVGTLVSQADGIPDPHRRRRVRGARVAEGVRRQHREGDAFVLNDPYAAGGNHLPTG